MLAELYAVRHMAAALSPRALKRVVGLLRQDFTEHDRGITRANKEEKEAAGN